MLNVGSPREVSLLIVFNYYTSEFVLAASSGLSPPQTQYSVYELETLAIQWALTKIKPYLFGGHPNMVLTDHRSLAGLEA